jgi:hypothetical protein
MWRCWWLLLLLGCEGPDAACRQSPQCELDGLCAHHRADGCVAIRAEDCRASAGCLIHGRCSFEGGRCVVAADEDCRKAEVCQEDGSCSRVIRHDGIPTCAPPCAQRLPCRAAGSCERVDGRCRATKDAFCQASDACRFNGFCTAVDGACKATSPADCKAAIYCTWYGRCHLSGGACVRKGEEDCASSRGCREFGSCAYEKRCRATRREHCRQSAWCKERGYCALDDGRCKLEPAGCAESRVCRDHGRCEAPNAPRGPCMAPDGTIDLERARACACALADALKSGAAPHDCAAMRTCLDEGEGCDVARQRATKMVQETARYRRGLMMRLGRVPSECDALF